MKRPWILVLISLAFAGWATYHVVTRQAPLVQHDPPVTPATVNFASQVAGVGLVEARTENLKIGAPFAGIVDEVYVRVGQTVKPGDPLFRLDPRQVSSHVAVAEARLAAATAELARLKAQPRAEDVPPVEAKRRRSEAAMVETKDAYERTKVLFERSVATEENLIAARSQLKMAEAQLEADFAEEAKVKAGAWQPDITIAEATVAQASAELGQYRTELARHTVLAPQLAHIASESPLFEVLKVDIRPGESAPATSDAALVVLGDVRTKHLRVDIDEHDIARFRPTYPAVALVRGDSEARYDLSFVRLEPYVIPKRSLTGDSTERVDTRVMQVIYQIAEEGKQPVYVGQQMDVFIECAPSSASPEEPTAVAVKE